MLQTPKTVTAHATATSSELGAHIYSMLSDARTLRRPLEAEWDTMYALYRASKEDMNHLFAASFEHGSKKQWKHRINTGKTFEIVETLVAYFKGATFPSDDWFNVEGKEPNLSQVSGLIKQLAKSYMSSAKLVTHFDEWLRNLAIFGVSTMKVWWESCPELKTKRTFDELGLPVDTVVSIDKEKLCVKETSPYDVWFDATSRDLNKGGVFTRLHLTKQELHYYASTGYYTIDPEVVERYDDTEDGDPNVVKTTNRSERGEIVEYYGYPLFDGVQYWCTHAVFFDNTLIRLADSAYWCGSPYVSAPFLPDRDSAYGMSVLHPSIGGLHILNVLTNSRLDNIALHIDKMFTFVDDGMMRQEDVYTEPGKVFKVAQHGNLQPVDLGPPTFTVTYNEGAVQEQAIDRVCSTGPLIGGGQPRGGERVTAEEITAVQQSGGNRLAALLSRIEDLATKPLLAKVFSLMQQYVVTPETVKVFMPEVDTYAFFTLDPEYLSFPFDLEPVGANYIVEKQRTTADLMQLFDIAGRVPQLAEKLDFDKILLEVMKQMRFKNPTSYLKTESSTPAPLTPPPATLDSSLGGEPMQQGLEQSILEGGSQDLLAGVGVDASNIPPEELAAMTQQLLTNTTTQGEPNV